METLHTLTMTLTDDELALFEGIFGHMDDFDPADLFRAFLQSLACFQS